MYEIVTYSCGDEYLVKDKIIVKLIKDKGYTNSKLPRDFKICIYKAIRQLTDNEKVALL